MWIGSPWLGSPCGSHGLLPSPRPFSGFPMGRLEGLKFVCIGLKSWNSGDFWMDLSEVSLFGKMGNLMGLGSGNGSGNGFRSERFWERFGCLIIFFISEWEFEK